MQPFARPSHPILLMGRREIDEFGIDSDLEEELLEKPTSTMLPIAEGPHTKSVFSPYSFADVGVRIGKDRINGHVVRQMESCGFSRMTYIQQHAIPIIMAGRDTLLRSYTGSGKTLCFVVPIISMLTNMKEQEGLSRSDGTVVVMVSPTRELCMQTFEITQKLSQNSPYIVTSCLTGGEKRKSEKARLRKGVTILMGTPGRLRDHLETTSAFHAPKLRTLVLDEADRLLDLGFERVLRTIYDELVANVRKTTDKDVAKEVLRELMAEQKAARRKEQAKTLSFDSDSDLLSDGFSSDSEDSLGSGSDEDELDMVLNVKGRLKVPPPSAGPSKASPKAKSTPPAAVKKGSQQTAKAAVEAKNVVKGEDGEDVDIDALLDGDEAELDHEEVVDTSPMASHKGPKERVQDIQVVLVSATLTPAVIKLADFCIRGKPAWVALVQKRGGAEPEAIVESNANDLIKSLEQNAQSGEYMGDEGSLDALEKRMMSVPAHLDQKYLQVTLKTRLVALIACMMQYGLNGKAVVFCSSCQSVEFHQALFESLKWPSKMDSKAIGEAGEGITTLLSAVDTEENRMAIAEFLENDDVGMLRGGGAKSAKRFAKKQEQKKMGEDREDGEDILDQMDEYVASKREGEVSGLVFQGVPMFKLHGKLQREDRLGYLADFTRASNGVLFTTDVAARGLNLPHVDAVIQLDPPQQAEEYAHRVGRTARLDQAGSSILFLLEHETGFSDQLVDRGAKLKQMTELSLFDSFRHQFAPGHLHGIRSLPQFLGGWVGRFVAGRPELLRSARESFLAARRAYSTFSKELKGFFDVSKLHLGHLAGGFGLKETPAQIAMYAKRARDKDSKTAQEETDRTRRGEAMRKGRQGHTNEEFDAGVEGADLQAMPAIMSKSGKQFTYDPKKSVKDNMRAKHSAFKAPSDVKKGPGALSLAAKAAPKKFHYTPPANAPALPTVARAAGSEGSFSVDDVVKQALKSVKSDLVTLNPHKAVQKKDRQIQRKEAAGLSVGRSASRGNEAMPLSGGAARFEKPVNRGEAGGSDGGKRRAPPPGVGEGASTKRSRPVSEFDD